MRTKRFRAALLMTVGTSLVATAAAARGGELPDGKDLYHRAASFTDWIYEVQSVRLHATLTFVLSPEAIAQRKIKYAKEDGDRFDPVNPIWAGRLRPNHTGQIDLAWDRSRVRSKTEIEGSVHETGIWNGNQGFNQLQFAGYRPSPLSLTGDVPSGISNSFFTWLPWNGTGYHVAPWKRLWIDNEESRTIVERNYGAGADWKCWGEVEFDGAKCWLLYRAEVGNWARYYIEVGTGRFRGVREGTWGTVWHKAIEPIFAKALRQKGLTPVADRSALDRFEKLPASIKTKIQGELKDEITAAYFRVLPDLEPCFETILSDYREAAPGRFFPMRQQIRLWVMASGEPLVDEHRDVAIDVLRIDEPLDRRLFEWSIPENAEVFDTTRGVPLRYRQDSQRSEEEWQKLIAAARVAKNADNDKQAALQALIGRPAPEWPAGLIWLNSEPLTWEKLRGHWVVVDFWHIGCGPCWGSNGMPYVEAVHRHEVAQEVEKDRVVTISLHGSGATEGQIREAIAEQLKAPITAPIVIDATDKASAWGQLTGAYRVKQMPYAVVVGPDGVIAGHGNVQDAVTLARKLRAAVKAK